MRRAASLMLLVALAACGGPPAVDLGRASDRAAAGSVGGCALFPADSHWYATVADLPVHPSSEDWVAAIGVDATVHPDFGSGTFEGGPIGIPITLVDDRVPDVAVTFDFADESDPGPYPIPEDVLIEGGPDADGDRHVLLVDTDACTLHELYDARPSDGTAWTAGSGAIFDLASNALRPDGWTSADAAGLPILPGLVRFEEVQAGVVDHAIRMTAPRTDRSWIWPARHQAGAADDPTLPPMGAWFRLDPTIDPTDFPAQARPIVVALQTHGAILADNGSAWFISGVPDARWDNDALRALRDIPGDRFDAVDTTGLLVDPDSGAARGPGSTSGRESGRLSGASRIDTAVAISRAQFPEGADTVYLARADNSVDAVAGGVLTDGPILLVPQCGQLPAVVAEEIARLDPARVVALGGTGAVCDTILEDARTA